MYFFLKLGNKFISSFFWGNNFLTFRTKILHRKVKKKKKKKKKKIGRITLWGQATFKIVLSAVLARAIFVLSSFALVSHYSYRILICRMFSQIHEHCRRSCRYNRVCSSCRQKLQDCSQGKENECHYETTSHISTIFTVVTLTLPVVTLTLLKSDWRDDKIVMLSEKKGLTFHVNCLQDNSHEMSSYI